MKISTKGRYALEIVTDLAVHSDTGTSGKSEGSVAAQRIVGEILGANRQRVKNSRDSE